MSSPMATAMPVTGHLHPHNGTLVAFQMCYRRNPLISSQGLVGVEQHSPQMDQLKSCLNATMHPQSSSSLILNVFQLY